MEFSENPEKNFSNYKNQVREEGVCKSSLAYHKKPEVTPLKHMTVLFTGVLS